MASLGAEVVGVPVDDQGLVVEAIPPRTRLVHVTPSHQFPLGVAMSLPRRLALLAWAERHDAAVVEDDYDSEFRYGGRPIEPLQTLDRSGRVIYVGSFSKTLLATLRLGFLVTPSSLVAAVRSAKYLADWHTPLPTQAALADFIDQGLFARHLRRMRMVYQRRHRQIVESLDDRFADHLKPVPSHSGPRATTASSSTSPPAATWSWSGSGSTTTTTTGPSCWPHWPAAFEQEGGRGAQPAGHPRIPRRPW
jgi:GntR family transcriptional regulator/MocR family aminotransferase